MTKPLMFKAEVPFEVKAEEGGDGGAFEILLFTARNVTSQGWFADPLGAHLFESDRVAYFLDNHDPSLKLGVAELLVSPDEARLVGGKWFSTPYAQQARIECLEAQQAGMAIKASVGMIVEHADMETVNSADGLVVPFEGMQPPFTHLKRMLVTEGSRVIAGAHASARLLAASRSPEDTLVRDWYRRELFSGATLEGEGTMASEQELMINGEKAGSVTGSIADGQVSISINAEWIEKIAAAIGGAVLEGVTTAVKAMMEAEVDAVGAGDSGAAPTVEAASAGDDESDATLALAALGRTREMVRSHDHADAGGAAAS